MHGNVPAAAGEAIQSTADLRHQRQHLAEPLWFALMCRELWGANAPKELRFILEKYDGRQQSERTCRAWAAGDCEPGASVLAILIVSDHGLRVVSWIVRTSAVTWWANVQRALRITADEDKIDRS